MGGHALRNERDLHDDVDVPLEDPHAARARGQPDVLVREQRLLRLDDGARRAHPHAGRPAARRRPRGQSRRGGRHRLAREQHPRPERQDLHARVPGARGRRRRRGFDAPRREEAALRGRLRGLPHVRERPPDPLPGSPHHRPRLDAAALPRLPRRGPRLARARRFHERGGRHDHRSLDRRRDAALLRRARHAPRLRLHRAPPPLHRPRLGVPLALVRPPLRPAPRGDERGDGGEGGRTAADGALRPARSGFRPPSG